MKSAEAMTGKEPIDTKKAKASEAAALSGAGEEKPDGLFKRSLIGIFGLASVLVFAGKKIYEGLEKVSGGGGGGGGSHKSSSHANPHH